MTIVTLTKSNFDSVVAKNDVVIVDFWAQWCGPCKTFSKIYEAAAKQYPDIVFGSVDIEAEPELANDFNVRSIPFVLILRQNIAIFAESGALPAKALDDLIAQAKALDMEKVCQQIQMQKEEGKPT